jgi:uncharacterized protein DUF4430
VTRRARRPALTLAAVVAALALAGCGLGPGDEPQGTRLTVTDGFGARTLVQRDAPEARGEETVMRLLQRNARVTTRYGGSFVQSIDGRAGGREGGRPVDWFFYVNGVEAGEGAASTTVEDGDRIWWDRHDWGAAMRVPAVVGSFPEPFVNGIGGKRYPVRVECADPGTRACRAVQRRLTDEDIPAAAGRLRTVAAMTTLRVVVGPWARISGDIGVVRLEDGPQASGVFARPSADGKRLDLLDAHGRTTRTLGAGAGLVAATRAGDDAPLWVVTGTDDAGVAAAARAFDEGPLADHFALAIADDVGVPLPMNTARPPRR